MWTPWTISEAAALLAGAPARWWVSGGVAVDRWLGFRSRDHGDLDVSVARADWPALGAHLAHTVQVWIAEAGRVYPLCGRPVTAGSNNLWLRESTGGPWRLQVNLEDVAGDTWIYRRDRRVTRPFADTTWTSDGVLCVRPAVQLLWKAETPRPQDEHDYTQVVPRLDQGERRWLATAIRLAHPASPWVTRLP